MSKKKVVVAMSGGVDSSVAACLLKDRGFQVIGITMQIWPRLKSRNRCCGLESIEDARRVADQIGIAHYVLNFRNAFQEKVIADFCKEYREGRTPNPCIRCNQYIKFDLLLRKARQLDAGYIATGHYARIEFDAEKEKFLLKKGIDPEKDQSYVLYMLTQQQLQHTIFPLGELTKQKVREIARNRRLPVADKSESQEICFIADNRYGEFLQEYLPQASCSGPIVNQQGETIGQHQGIIFYTIGQRKGIGIAAQTPLYVTGIDKETNTVVVGKREDAYSDQLIAEEVNFIYDNQLRAPQRVKVKVRYQHPEAAATLSGQAPGRVRVKFDQPQWAITPGQAAVFYQGELVLGGGTIFS